MIYDHIKNCKNYCDNKKFREAFEFLQGAEGKALGRYELKDGMYANIMEFNTIEESMGKTEAHKRFIDLQFIAKGEETMGFANKFSSIAEEYDEKKDIYFVNAPLQYVSLKAGEYAIFYPTDYHRPSIGNGDKVKKIVVKIPV